MVVEKYIDVGPVKTRVPKPIKQTNAESAGYQVRFLPQTPWIVAGDDNTTWSGDRCCSIGQAGTDPALGLLWYSGTVYL